MHLKVIFFFIGGVYRIGMAALFLLTMLVTLSIAVHGALPPVEAGKPQADLLGRPLDPAAGPFASGYSVYTKHCATCHDVGGDRIPPVIMLQDMTPGSIYAALSDGAMRGQGEILSKEEKIAVSEFITSRKMLADSSAQSLNMCSESIAKFDPKQPTVFTNWGLDLKNTHFIPADVAGVDRRNVGKLTLKWAYAFPDSQRMRSQPAIAGGAVILGNHTGVVRALDFETGCVRWSFEAAAEVRTAIVVSNWDENDRDVQPLAYFGDLRGNVYAVDARNGELVWKVLADTHSAALITGAPALHQGTLYVPVSSIEEATAATPGYVCCSFRGSILALDAQTGEEKWRRYLVGEAKATADGGTLWGPSGVAVWNSPAIDEQRGQLYIATGDNYSQPTTGMSDSIVALDLKTGKFNWHYQALEGDAWNVACFIRASGNCPEDSGPDFDFGAGTILASDKDGRELLLAGQKSGIVYGIDPDTGKLVWQTRVGRGGLGGGILFGLAAANGHVFVPIIDLGPDPTTTFPASPGLYALDIANGEFVWRAPASNICKGRTGCIPGIGGSISVTPELVLAGSEDGHIRIYDSATGKILWDRDTNVDVLTVNGVPGHGGAISGGAAPIVYKGRVIVASGYGYASKLPGNVLLVYGVE